MNKLRQAINSGRISSTQDKNIEVLFDDGSSHTEKGRLEFSSMIVDQATGAISLRAVVDNPKFDLLPGMFVRVRVPVADANNTIKVPQKAVTVAASGPEVYMIQEQKLVPVKVELGPMSGDFWIIKSGLKTGDRVVISDTTMVKSLGVPVVGMTEKEMQAARQ